MDSNAKSATAFYFRVGVENVMLSMLNCLIEFDIITGLTN